MLIIKNFLKRIIPWMNQKEKIYKLYKKSRKYAQKNNFLLLSYYSYKILKKYRCVFSAYAVIDESIILPHPMNIVIGRDVIIGKNCTIYQDVTIGQNNEKFPVIGDNVTIYTGAKVIGNIKVGNNSVIGANAVVIKDVPDNSVVAGVPARVIKQND